VRPLIAFLLLAPLVQAQDDTARDVSELLRKLRSDQSDVRDEAQKKLQAIGAPAVLALERAVRDSDAEYAARAAAVLKFISEEAFPLTNPGCAAMKKQAPAAFKVRFTTTQGAFTITVTRDWAPAGADRFYNLARHGYYNDCRFFRIIAGFACQFGIHGDPAVSAKWKNAAITDDPVKEGNKTGRITFAARGSNSRTTQLFINLKDNPDLDGKGFAAFGEVSEGMDVVQRLYADYGEGAPRGKGPDQIKIQSGGNSYLAEFGKLDFIRKTEILD